MPPTMPAAGPRSRSGPATGPDQDKGASHHDDDHSGDGSEVSGEEPEEERRDEEEAAQEEGLNQSGYMQ